MSLEVTNGQHRMQFRRKCEIVKQDGQPLVSYKQTSDQGLNRKGKGVHPDR